MGSSSDGVNASFRHRTTLHLWAQKLCLQVLFVRNTSWSSYRGMIQFCNSATDAIARHWLTGTTLSGEVLKPLGQHNMHNTDCIEVRKTLLRTTESGSINFSYLVVLISDFLDIRGLLTIMHRKNV